MLLQNRSGVLVRRNPKWISRWVFLLLISFTSLALSAPARAGQWDQYHPELRAQLGKIGATSDWEAGTGTVFGTVGGIVTALTFIAPVSRRFVMTSGAITALFITLGVRQPFNRESNRLKISTLMATKTFQELSKVYGEEVTREIAETLLSSQNIDYLKRDLTQICQTSDSRTLCSEPEILNLLIRGETLPPSGLPAVNTDTQAKVAEPQSAWGAQQAVSQEKPENSSAVSGKEQTYEGDRFDIYSGH